jgi:O-glycosyl hydrolase
MDQKDRIAKAIAAMRAKQDARSYVVTWRSSADHKIYKGFGSLTALATMLRISAGTLGNYLSRGKGSHQRKAINPTTGELDIMTITMYDPPHKEKRKRGRPPKAETLAKRAEAQRYHDEWMAEHKRMKEARRKLAR